MAGTEKRPCEMHHNPGERFLLRSRLGRRRRVEVGDANEGCVCRVIGAADAGEKRFSAAHY
jgi:hypothetical protein